MESKLKALKVVDLKAILATASVSLPAKANKQDLINTILASQPALDAYNTLHDVPTEVDPPKVPENKPEPPKAKPAEPPKLPPKAEPAVEPTADAPPASEPSVVEPAAVAPVDLELEKRKKRAARFGIPLVEPKPDRKNASRKKLPAAADDPERIKSRAVRFGVTAKPTSSPPSKRKAPATVTEEVDAEELARRKKRAERFGPKAA
ncbi:uncharacterized protein BT62DRAFT_318297 [Guyanagaster necrorhizus]|uniref:THO1-MOS11 C-terminal domain-containing protein n=1 Tax=Guyanagaster necrorhizus TaxID=856835 RepID=A0A9P7VNH6_9AGAR|nr:uncharacterized protein BT62DRAFT_318297 [Guyanagaster necrorhizus MCA 3950]KAG7443580.1 hypothetical protein BT62DRAFT_318297 [Guyanagaster necrorhizus MCA 3950]